MSSANDLTAFSFINQKFIEIFLLCAYLQTIYNLNSTGQSSLFGAQRLRQFDDRYNPGRKKGLKTNSVSKDFLSAFSNLCV